MAPSERLIKLVLCACVSQGGGSEASIFRTPPPPPPPPPPPAFRTLFQGRWPGAWAGGPKFTFPGRKMHVFQCFWRSKNFKGKKSPFRNGKHTGFPMFYGSVHSVQCTVHSAQGQCTGQCTVHRDSAQDSVHSTVYRAPCTVHRVQCTVYSGQCTVHSAQCTTDRAADARSPRGPTGHGSGAQASRPVFCSLVQSC